MQTVVERCLLDVAEYGHDADVAGVDYHEAREDDDEEPEQDPGAPHRAADRDQRQP